MTSTDYIPPRLADFATWLQNFAALVAADPTDYGLVAGDATAITAQNVAFQAAFVLSTEPSTRTSATVAATAGARLSAEAVVRPYAMRINANQTVSDAQRVDLGLTVRTVVPTPIPPPTTSPAITLRSATPGILTLESRSAAGAAGKAKPSGAVGLEIWVAIGTVAAVAPEAGRFTAISTKSPFQLAFAAADKGKLATVFGRWITRSGAGGIASAGPWSAPLTSHIV